MNYATMERYMKMFEISPDNVINILKTDTSIDYNIDPYMIKSIWHIQKYNMLFKMNRIISKQPNLKPHYKNIDDDIIKLKFKINHKESVTQMNSLVNLKNTSKIVKNMQDFKKRILTKCSSEVIKSNKQNKKMNKQDIKRLAVYNQIQASSNCLMEKISQANIINPVLILCRTLLTLINEINTEYKVDYRTRLFLYYTCLVGLLKEFKEPELQIQ